VPPRGCFDVEIYQRYGSPSRLFTFLNTGFHDGIATGASIRVMRITLRLLCSTVALALVMLSAAVSSVTATTTTVTNCSNDSQLSSALVGGGTITFNCGIATIILSSTKVISAATTINGGGKITLSGDNARTLFNVGAGTSLDLINIVLTKGNAPNSTGGAIAANGFLALDNATVRDSSAGFGGAVAISGSSDITNSIFFGNTAHNGGAIYAVGSAANVTISGSSFHDNSATGAADPNGNGGAIAVDENAQVNIYSSDIFSNTARLGGAISVPGSAPHGNLSVLAATKIHGNHASSKGNGIFNNGTVTLDNTTISGNTPTMGQIVLGGGIYNYGTLTVTSSTIDSNTAYVGAGLSNVFSHGATLTNVTLSSNTATAYGAGLDNFHATATLTHVTIANNKGGTGTGTNTGGGILNEADGGTTPLTVLYLRSVLFSNNAGGNCTFGKAPALTVTNMSTDGTCGFGTGRNNVLVALGPLETNGGLTLTHRLLPGSAAIDKGNNAGAPFRDQRGLPRPQNGKVDVGAVEFIPCAGQPDSQSALLFPPPDAVITSTQPVLDWAGPDCATSFKVQVRKGSTTGTTVFSKSVFPASQAKSVALTHAKTYFWRVKACNAIGCFVGDWSSFKVN